VTVQEDSSESFYNTLVKPTSKVAQTADFLAHFVFAQFTCSAEADDIRHGQRATAQTTFLTAALDDRLKDNARPGTSNVQGTNAFGTVNLVGAQAEQIDAQFIDIQGNPASSLHGVSMEDNATLLAQATDCSDRLDRADFVIGCRETYQDGLVSHLPRQLVRPKLARIRPRAGRSLGTPAFQSFAGVEHGLVFSRDGDDMVALAVKRGGGATESQVMLSVAPLVKTISLLLALMRLAT